MKTLQNVLLCAPFFGLVTAALPGCYSDSAASERPEDILCGKMAECGRLSGGVTVEQCATNLGQLHTQAVSDMNVCTPAFEQLRSLEACMAPIEECEGDVAAEAEELPADHPCFEENESYRKALQKVVDKSRDSDAGTLCAFYYGRSIDMATTPATGKACTTNADCPDVECPDPAHGRSGYCQSRKCKTAIDVCG